MRGWKLSLVRSAQTYIGWRNEDFGIKILHKQARGILQVICFEILSNASSKIRQV